MPCSSSRAAVFGPTPNSRPTGSGSSVARTSSGRITVSPSGLSISEASFASSLLCETPTEAVRPGALADALLDLARHLLAAAEQARAAGDVEEGLVEREPLDQVRELAEHLEYLAETSR